MVQSVNRDFMQSAIVEHSEDFEKMFDIDNFFVGNVWVMCVCVCV